MAITALDKIKITKYLNEHQLGNMFYNSLRNAINNKKCQNKDIIIYFLDTMEEKLKENKINNKLMAKMLAAIHYLISKENDNVDQVISQRLLNISLLYEEYLQRNNEEKDGDISYYLEKISELELENVHSEDKDSSNIESLNIEDIKERLKKEEKKLEELRKKYVKSESSLSDKREKIKSLNKEIAELNKQIKELSETISEQIKDIENFEQQNLEIKREYGKKEKELVNLNDRLTRKYNALLIQIADLQKMLKEKDSKMKAIEIESLRKQEEKKKIRETIINKLSHKEYLLEELLVELQSEGFNLNAEKLFNILNKINEEITIIDPHAFPPIYRLTKPEILVNQSLNINTSNQECYDIFLTSDFHIYSLLPFYLEKYNTIYEYCAKNGIGLILNLGDFINDIPGDGKNKIKYYQKIIAEIITKFPESPNINQVIMGGNHDKDSFQCGIDVLKTISKNRRDLITIGYDEAKIYIASDTRPLILHHFNERISTHDLLIQKIKEYYSRNSLKPDQSFINFAGHLHKSMYDYKNNFCIVPSPTHDRVQNGAWHLKIYLNNDGTINYIMLIPLIFLENKLIPTSEIIHERKLIKKL